MIICAIAALMILPAARAAIARVMEYVGWNLVFLNFKAPGLPGVFATNRFHEVNGALWTMKLEVMFYILLPALTWLVRASGRMRWVVAGLVYVGAEAWRAAFEAAGNPEIARQLPGQMSFFISGIAFCMMKLDTRRLQLAGLIGAGLLVLSLFLPLCEPLRAAGLGGGGDSCGDGFEARIRCRAVRRSFLRPLHRALSDHPDDDRRRPVRGCTTGRTNRIAAGRLCRSVVAVALCRAPVTEERQRVPGAWASSLRGRPAFRRVNM